MANVRWVRAAGIVGLTILGVLCFRDGYGKSGVLCCIGIILAMDV